MTRHLPIEPIDRNRDAACAELLVTSEPWLTLRLKRETALAALTDPGREVHAIRDANGIAGFVVIDMRGLLRGYVQILCVRADCRRRGLGSAFLQGAEDRIFRDSPNVFRGGTPTFTCPGTGSILARRDQTQRRIEPGEFVRSWSHFSLDTFLAQSFDDSMTVIRMPFTRVTCGPRCAGAPSRG